MSKIDTNDVARDKGPAGLAAELDAKTARASTNSHNAHSADDWPAPIPFQHVNNLPPFPVDALPGWAGEIVVKVAVATQTPPDLAGGLLLSTLAVCAAGKLKVAINSGWTEPLNIFTVTALPPGNRKSTVFSTITAPLAAWERAEAERLGPEIAQAKAEADVIEQRLKETKARAAKCKDAGEAAELLEEVKQLAVTLAGMVIPIAPRLFVDDVTPEALAKLICEHDGRMAVMSAEGDVFEIMAGRYSEGANFGIYLKGHAGDSLRVNRLGRGPDYVESPALTLGLCVQPDVVESLSQKPGFRGRGLLGRFLYSIPISRLGSREIEPPAVPEYVLKDYERRMMELLDLPRATDADGKPYANILKLAPEARAVLQSFEAALEPKLKAGGELDAITDWAAKLAGAVARLAGCLHLVTFPADPWLTPITATTMKAAVALGHYFTKHAEAAFCLMGADPTTNDAKRAVAWIERNGCTDFTRRDLCQALRVKAADLTESLKLLIEHDYIRPRLEPTRSGPGRKHTAGPYAFDVNPRIK
jgi:hypothetical protein